MNPQDFEVSGPMNGVAELSYIAVHPIKALDPLSLSKVGFSAAGGLTDDRAYAIVDEDGTYINGKRTAAVHPIRATYDSEKGTVHLELDESATVDPPGERVDAEEFYPDDERAELESWLSTYFGISITLKSGDGGSQTDGAVYGDSSKAGPTVVSEATLGAVGSWYGLSGEEMRRRMRPNLVVSGVPAFWEDRLVDGQRVRIGDITLEGEKVLPRCVVPKRDSQTGAETPGFQQRFVTQREATLPEWTDVDRFDGNLYRLAARLRVPENERNADIRVGDEVSLVE